MKTTPYLVLIASLGLNFFLGIAFLKEKPVAASTTTKTLTIPQVEHDAKPAVVSAMSGQRLLWHRLGSNDLSQLVANLRAANLPPAKISYIVHHLLTEKYAKLINEESFGNEEPPYWRGSEVLYEMNFNNRQKQARREALWQQRRAEEAQLLGDDLWLAEGIPLVDHIRQVYSNILSAKKLSTLRDLENEYSAMVGPLQTSSNDPANKEKLKLLEKEFQKDVAQILTPAEQLERDLRYGNAAHLLQTRCNYFAATEAEYRALFPIYQQIDKSAPYSDWDEVDEKTRTARKEAEYQAQAQIAAILGPARYVEFKQANDQNALKENQLATRLGYPLSTATQLCALKTETTARAEQIRKDATLSVEQRTTLLTTLKSEAESGITSAIGSRGLDAYQQHAGSWLQSLTRAPQKNNAP